MSMWGNGWTDCEKIVPGSFPPCFCLCLSVCLSLSVCLYPSLSLPLPVFLFLELSFFVFAFVAVFDRPQRPPPPPPWPFLGSHGFETRTGGAKRGGRRGLRRSAKFQARGTALPPFRHSHAFPPRAPTNGCFSARRPFLAACGSCPSPTRCCPPCSPRNHPPNHDAHPLFDS